MLGFEVAPKHVLHAVGGVEHADADAPAGFVQGVEEHALALVVDQVALPQEGLVVQDAFVQRPGIFRQAQRGIGPQQLGQVDGIGERVRDGQRGFGRVDVHRRDVEFQVRADGRQKKAADAVELHPQPGIEPHLNPVGVDSFPQD